jgi:hypothetical protein
MSANVGMVDRAIRILVGLGLVSLVFVGPNTLWGLIGLLPLLTGLAGFCPAYRVTGMGACDLQSPEVHKQPTTGRS